MSKRGRQRQKDKGEKEREKDSVGRQLTDLRLSNPSSCPRFTTHPLSLAHLLFPSITNATCLGTGPLLRILKTRVRK
jgi:hypothetical protein